MYAYELGGAREVAEAIWQGVARAIADGRLDEERMRELPFENFLLLALIDVSDSGDSQLCSRAMQLLKRQGRVRYSKRRRAWQILRHPNDEK